jgi:serine protease Do
MHTFVKSTIVSLGLLVTAFVTPSLASADSLPDSVLPMLHDAQKAVVTIDIRSALDENDHSQGGNGSGSILTSDGLILTNCHVACDSMLYTVIVGDKRYSATFVQGTGMGRMGNDVAFIRITNPPAEGFPTLELGDSDALQVGQTVIAVGSPLGVENTVTSGIVSALGRPGVSIHGDIQHDADIFGGNSGGPLLAVQDGKLKIVGMNTYVIGAGKDSKGLVFAVPVKTVEFFLDQIHADGYDGTLKWGRLGVNIQSLDADTAANLGVPADKIRDHSLGVYVAKVMPDSPAAKAGFEALDVILSFNGKAINGENLPSVVAQAPVGTPVTAEVVRDGEVITLTVSTVNAWTPIERAEAEAYADSFGVLLADRGTPPYLKLFAGKIEAYEGYMPPFPMIGSVANGSPAHEAGLVPGLFITGIKIKGKPVLPVQSVAALSKAFKFLSDNNVDFDTVTLLVMGLGASPSDEPMMKLVTMTPRDYVSPEVVEGASPEE